MLFHKLIITLTFIVSHSSLAYQQFSTGINHILFLQRTRTFTSSSLSSLLLSNRFTQRFTSNKYNCILNMSTEKSNEEWMSVLTPSQFNVLRMKATEPPGFSERTVGELEYELKKKHGSKFPKSGSYECVACGSPLYTATSKFDSGCGWPAFYEGVPGAIKEVPDADGRRIEILCNNCGSHLGHVFKGEGFPTPTDERHCVNGICLRFNPQKDL